MLTNEREQKICDKYSKRDENNKVHCKECPLNKGQGSYNFRCKANSHYDRKTGEWEYDENNYNDSENNDTEIWHGIHGQVIAPKGTFEKIWNEAKEDDYNV